MTKPTDQPTIGSLLADATRDISSIIHDEIALAKSELRVSVRAGGMGSALLAAAAFIVLLAVVLVPFTVAFFLTMTGLHIAWAFLIVTVSMLIIAGLIGWYGTTRFKKVTVPERTLDSARRLPETFRAGSTSDPWV
ncbi:MAG TPA: phage holin family protein [Aeromicrobium sp.]|nr:phage holin family protein [Aeromicrobium sp.]